MAARLAFSSLAAAGFGCGAFSAAPRRFDLHDRRADFDRVAFADENLGDLAGLRRGDRHRGLVGLDLEQVLVGFHGVAFADEDRQHVAGFDVFAEIGELDLGWHSELFEFNHGGLRMQGMNVVAMNRGSICSNSS